MAKQVWEIDLVNMSVGDFEDRTLDALGADPLNPAVLKRLADAAMKKVVCAGDKGAQDRFMFLFTELDMAHAEAQQTGQQR